MTIFCVKCNHNRIFWSKCSNCIKQVTKKEQFNISLNKIILGWNIDDKYFTMTNILIELAAFAIYKSKMIYSDTNKLTPIEIIFITEIKKLDDVINKSSKKHKVYINKKTMV